MAYLKLPTCGPNYAVGYQTINQARDNVDSQFEAFRVWHGVEEYLTLGGFGRPAPPRIREFGTHDDERIPRASVRVTQRTSGGLVLVNTSANRVLGGGLRSSAGKYAWPVLGLKDFWAMAEPVGNGVSVITSSCKSVYPVGSASFLQVETFVGTSGFDCPFTLTIYGNP